MPDKIGLDVETTQSSRSTVFHAYCDTGKWPDGLRSLPEADREEIGGWKVPMPFVYKVGNVTHALPYSSAYRETRVALDKDFNAVIVDKDIPQSEIAAVHPEVMVVGHLDMAWVVDDLVIICDIKSSIFAVKDRCDSLQLHGYGMGLAVLLNKPRYLTSIWDASDGRYYVNFNGAMELDSFEAEEIKDRIRRASEDREGGFRTGTHCSGCWKRSHCPAHLVDVPEGDFKALLSGQATQKDVREALVKLKQIGDLTNRVGQSVKDWVSQHGPVLSEDGKKHYRVEMRAGKDSLDKDAVQKALGVENLNDYMKKGKEYPVFDWRKRD
jgi:hypothetical protein